MNSLVFILPLALFVFMPSVTQGVLNCNAGYSLTVSEDPAVTNGTFATAVCLGTAAEGYACLRYDIKGTVGSTAATVFGGRCMLTTACLLLTCDNLAPVLAESEYVGNFISASECGVNCCNNADNCNTAAAELSAVGTVVAGADGNMANGMLMSVLSFASLATAYWMK